MAHLILICTRDRAAPGPSEERLAAAARRITPEHLPAPELLVLRSPGLTAALIGRRDAVPCAPGAIALGCLNTRALPNWTSVGGGRPEAAALVRWNDDTLEALADATASRTLWHLSTPEALWLSTSQRALVYLTGAFERNEDVLPWFLAGGNLGPHRAGWDRRLKAVGPDGWLRLDRAAWRLDLGEPELIFDPLPGDETFHRERLRAALEATFADADPGDGRWLLPLSGGLDSRTILLFARQAGWHPPCVTWGLASERSAPGSDVAVALELARRLRLDHRFLVLDAVPPEAERMLRRFVAYTEGRCDAIGGYVDGFELWRGLRESGMGGILRGDEGFGWDFCARQQVEVRLVVGAPMLGDLEGIGPAESLGLPPQRLPRYWERRPDESLRTQFDRLHQQFRAATVLAALTHAKAHYVEVASPLLHRLVLRVVNSTPEELRLHRALLPSLGQAIGPPVPFATQSAIPTPWQTIGRPDVAALLEAELGDPAAEGALPPEVLALALPDLARAVAALAREGAPRRKAPLARRLSRRLKRLLRPPAPTVQGPPSAIRLAPGQLGFRSWLAVETQRLYAQDATAGQQAPR